MPPFKYPDDKWGLLKEVEQMYQEERVANPRKRLNAIRLLMMRRPIKEIHHSHHNMYL